LGIEERYSGKGAEHRGTIMARKHVKLNKPSDADLYRNPLIGGSKGAAMAQVTPEELEDFEGVNTFEGDVENDTNAQGGVDKAEVRNRRRAPPRKDRASGSRTASPQGRKTHEQQLRMLERKPDLPDARQLEQDNARAEESAKLPRHEDARNRNSPSVAAASTRRASTTSTTTQARPATSPRSSKDEHHGT
jgi:hypothetical protein